MTMKPGHARQKSGISVLLIACLFIYLTGAIQANESTSGNTKATATPAKNTEKKILYWVAPMDPNFRRDKPGKSPMGMDLIPVYDDGGTGDQGSSGSDGPVVRLTPEMIDKLGVRTADVILGDLPRRIDTVGYVDYDESHLSRITTRADGWIDRLAVNSIGERVRKGQVLFTVFAPTLVNAQEEYRQALSNGNKALVQASRERLIALGISEDQIANLEKTRRVQQWIEIRSPQNGIVTTLNIREGNYIKPSTMAMELADLNSVWVVAEVFEKQADWVRLGDDAVMKLPYLPGRVWNGRVAFIYPALDPKTRTLQVRLQFDNPGELIKPNMYAKITLLANPKRDSLSIPREALIRTGSGDQVIMALGDGKFAPRKVIEGIESGDNIEILNGLKAGEKVVTSAQFLIDSEASFKASMLRMTDTDNESNATDSNKSISDINGEGTVSALDADKHSITLMHEPIAALNWPAMTMTFAVREGVTLAGIKAGDRIGFSLEKKGPDYVITQIATAVKQEAKP